jgi:peptidoglycan/xylan/chitin deacetylase (PgdA/CDA1 family)
MGHMQVNLRARKVIFGLVAAVVVAVGVSVFWVGHDADPSAADTGDPAGVVSFSFDDGQVGHFDNARPALEAAGMRGTFYIISDALSSGKKTMNAEQVKQLAAQGHEIGNHTRDHATLTTLSADEVRAEFADAQAAIKAKTGITPTTCAYPSGAQDQSVQTAAATFFRGCRGTVGGSNARGGVDTYNLRMYYIHSSTTADDIRKVADEAKRTKRWLILAYHGVGPVGSDDDVSADTFAAHVRAVQQTGVAVDTVAGGLAKMVGLTDGS